MAGGDVNLARGVGQQILRDPSTNPLSELAPYLNTADLRFVNLESQLSDQGGETQSKARLVFTGPPGGAKVLARANIEIVSLANNHMWDYGKKAFFETLDHLDSAGVKYAGSHRTPDAAYKPEVVRIKGWSTAWFAVTQIWNQGRFDLHPGKDHVDWASLPLLKANILQARKEHDLVFLSYHGGSEYVDVPMTWTQEFVRAVLHLGVDAVLGHHPHVPQGVGWDGDRPAFYSFGNLVFGMHSDHPWTGIGFLARLTYHRNAPVRVEACPYHIMGSTPLPFEGDTRIARQEQFRRYLKRVSVAVGGSTIGDPGADGCFPLAPDKPGKVPASRTAH